MTSLSPVGPAASAPYKAAIFMITAIFCFSMMNAAIKALEEEYSIVQIIFFARILSPLLAIWLALRAGGLEVLHTKRPMGHILRGLVALCSMATFIYALGHMTVSKAITINFAAPLFVAILAIIVLREKVGPRRWAAILIGFVGVIVIVRPDDGRIDLPSIVAIASAVFYGATVIMTRRLALTEHSATMLFYFGLMVSVLPGLALPWVWVTPTGDAIWLFALIALAGTVAWYLMAEAYRFGEATMIVPLDYTHLLWAVMFDWLIWATIPAWTTFAGGALIIGANLFILWREARLGRVKATLERP
ncbi:MAG: DMT family transporter [Dongiaceae bacterium]